MADEWNETLKCPNCRSTGTVDLLFAHAEDSPTVRGISEGFKVINTEYGPAFYCRSCDVSAEAQ